MSLPTLTTYGGELLDAGYPGQVSGLGPTEIETFINSGATVIDYGVAVARVPGNAPGLPPNCAAIAADADLICGITVKSPMTPASTDGLNTVNYKQYDAVPVMKFGYLYCTAFEAVRDGDIVISVTAQAGKLSGSKSGVAGAGRVAVPGAIWQNQTAAGKVGLIRISGGETGRTTT